MPKIAKVMTAKEVEKQTRELDPGKGISVGGVPGLRLRVSRPGEGTWSFRYRTNGGATRRNLKLGSYPATSLAKARKKALKTLGKVEDGEDPQRKRAQARSGGQSFRAMTEAVLKEYEYEVKNDKVRPRTLREYRRIIDTDLLPRWGKLPAGKVTREDVEALRDEIQDGRESPAMADATVRAVKTIFNRGLRRKFPGLKGNPALNVERPGCGKRDRYLLAGEVRAVWRACAPDVPGVGWAFRLALLTGQRMGSVASLRWEDVTEESAGPLWTIPPERFKGKRPHLVPLSPEALEVIDEAREKAASQTWVFPSQPPAKRPFLQAWNKSLARIRERAGIDHWTAHDFRRTFRTWATRHEEDGGLGVIPPVADAVLGHKEASLGYDRYTGETERYLLREKREALEAWGAWVREALEAEDEEDDRG